MLEPPHKEASTINTITFLSGQNLSMESANSKKEGSFSFGPFVFYSSVPTLLQSQLADPAIKTNENYRDVLISINEAIDKSPEVHRVDHVAFSTKPRVLNEDFLETADNMRQVYVDYDEDRQGLDKIVLTVTKKTKTQERQE